MLPLVVMGDVRVKSSDNPALSLGLIADSEDATRIEIDGLGSEPDRNFEQFPNTS